MVFEPYIYLSYFGLTVYTDLYINEHNTFHTQIKPIWLKTHWVHQIHICYQLQFVEVILSSYNCNISELIVENMGTHTAVKKLIFHQIVWGLGLLCLTPFSTIFQLWWSVLLVEETGVPRENHWPATSHWQTLSHNVVSSIPWLSWIQTHYVSGDRHWLHK